MIGEKFSFRQFIVPKFWKKFWLMFFAILLMGFFLSFLIEVGWGTDPASFMNLNISHLIGWTFGNWQIVINILMLIIVFIFEPSLIGFGTICNMILIGYTADFCCWLWAKNGIHELIAGGTVGIKIAFFAVAIVCFVIVAAVYMNAQMGLSPYDGCAKLFAGALKGIPFFVGRMIYDLGIVAIGFVAAVFSKEMRGSALGASIIGLLLGPVITAIAKPMKRLVE